ncbi:MAG: acyl carrier protein [Candidatus Woykebacteria bacterium GWB1_45_5]|uniref:Acyl carrier protein n=2 Tax=Candidatus Woykeibacteriota TaxID=1817899 RepID=A0A1G1W3J6_9BACT|nr:MAG: acyl carrier protein [Candidatus Woykebacteria bacterium GWA1_44_8]OGY24470.1 MAG: acyl carrier protein [Candidatus Woykebacteria bacterium GWB1_45_5]
MNELIFSKVRNLISSQLGVEEAEITPKSHLQEDLNADPLSIADLIVSLETEFNIKIPKEQIGKFSTVEDILNFIFDQTGEI